MTTRLFSPRLLFLFAASILLMVDAANAGRISAAGSCNYFETVDHSPTVLLNKWVARGNVNLARASRFDSLSMWQYSRVKLTPRRPTAAPRVVARLVTTKAFEPNWNFPATTIQRRWSYQHVAGRTTPAAATPISARKLESQQKQARNNRSVDVTVPAYFRIAADRLSSVIARPQPWLRWLADHAEVLPLTEEEMNVDAPVENYWSYYRDCDYWSVVLTSSLSSDRFAEQTWAEAAPDRLDAVAKPQFSIVQWLQPVRDWLASIRMAANRWSTELY